MIKGLSELQVRFHFLVVLSGFFFHKAVLSVLEPVYCQHLQPCYRRDVQSNFASCEETASFLDLLVFNFLTATFM